MENREIVESIKVAIKEERKITEGKIIGFLVTFATYYFVSIFLDKMFP